MKFSRKLTKILIISRKSQHPFETLDSSKVSEEHTQNGFSLCQFTSQILATSF